MTGTTMTSKAPKKTKAAKAATPAAKAAAKAKGPSKGRPGRKANTLTRPVTTSDDNHFLAQAVHDLGSALWFGGTVMGIAGVNKSGSELTQGVDRLRVASSAWTRFQPVQWGGIGATLLAGLQLTRVGGRRLALQKGFGTVGALKVGFVVAGAAATGYASYCGARIAQLTEEAASAGTALEVKDATLPSDGTPEELARWQRQQRLTQFLVPVLAGGNLVCNSWLVQSYRVGATTKGVLARLLPD